MFNVVVGVAHAPHIHIVAVGPSPVLFCRSFVLTPMPPVLYADWVSCSTAVLVHDPLMPGE